MKYDPAKPTLFDSSAEKSAAPMRHTESSIAFLDRVSWPSFERIRQELDAWFAAYAAEERSELFIRFRSEIERDHIAAWWELYLHQLMRRLGYTVEIHPSIPGTAKRPDFRVTAPSGSFLLEAVSTRAGIIRDDDRHEAREARFLDTVDTIRNTLYSVSVGEISVGAKDVPKKAIVSRMNKWLDSLNPASSAWTHELEALPTFWFEYADWRVEFYASRRGDHEEPEERHRLITAGPVVDGELKTSDVVRRNLDVKVKRYGRPAEPYVIAMLSDQDHLDRRDIASALFGPVAWEFNPDDENHQGRWVRVPDGVLLRGKRVVGQHVSAFIFASRLSPSTFMTSMPRVFHNIDAVSRLGLGDAFDRFDRFDLVAARGAIVNHRVGLGTAHEIFGLPRWWPGFDDE